MSDTIDDDNLLYSETKEATQSGTYNTNTTDGTTAFAHKTKMGSTSDCKTDDRAGTTETTTSSSGAVADGATTATSDNGARVGGSSGTLETNTMASKGEHPIRSIQDHALIGNLKTAALVSLDGSIESMCIPYFDSPRWVHEARQV
jgi:hypothetical protein